MKLLFIGGSARSGSTIVGNLLGSAAGFVHVGELHHVWLRGFAEDWLCGCKERVRRCPRWRAVLEEAFAGWRRADFEAVEQRRLEIYRALESSRSPADCAAWSNYASSLHSLYDALEKVFRPNVLVDSSKHPLHGRVLAELFGTRLHLLHLVRDPRAVAYSWRRRRVRDDAPAPLVMHRDGVQLSAALWLERNRQAEQLAGRIAPRRMRLRYEDFVDTPANHLSRVFDLLGQDRRGMPGLIERSAILAASHTIAGNPGRFQHLGAVRIESDDEWKRRMDPAEIAEVEALTTPALQHYGY